MNDANLNKPKGAGKSSFALINADLVADILPLAPGAAILDLACGPGHYSLFLSEIVGEAGLVYAVDLWAEGLSILGKEIEARGITNIKTLQADAAKEIPVDPGSIDICLMATVLHDFEEAGQTDNVIPQIKNLLKPNGCLAVIEFKKIHGPPGPPMHIRLSPEAVEKLLGAHGFEKKDAADIGDSNYLMTFQLK